jgi:hypothetical protein
MNPSWQERGSRCRPVCSEGQTSCITWNQHGKEASTEYTKQCGREGVRNGYKEARGVHEGKQLLMINRMTASPWLRPRRLAETASCFAQGVRNLRMAATRTSHHAFRRRRAGYFDTGWLKLYYRVLVYKSGSAIGVGSDRSRDVCVKPAASESGKSTSCRLSSHSVASTTMPHTPSLPGRGSFRVRAVRNQFLFDSG